MQIYNTLTRQKEEFKPLKEKSVSFYQCGPTVYWTQHIGNMRAVTMADLIARTFKYLGYDVNFVRNYTDVGHLTSDSDTGEDKMEKASKREGLDPQEIARKYISIYEKDIKEINTLSPTAKPLVTNHIQEIIDMINVLLKKSFAYQTDLAIYFDISKVKDYTKLSKQNIEEQQVGAGTGEISDSQKKNSADFSLWFFKKGTHAKALQTWNSPWGEGFPGWHIECSALIKKYLGDTIDIHMGGIEHIPIHHTNEIAQSESANGVKFVNYWVHNGHLFVDNGKMSKSEGTSYSISEIKEKGFDPLALRYFFLQAHYRSNQNFTWDALDSAQNGLKNLYEQVVELQKEKVSFWARIFKTNIGVVNLEFRDKFIEKLEDDFNTPQALAVVSELLKSDLSKKDKLATILDFDKVLGLKLNKAQKKVPQEISWGDLPKKIQELLKERQEARENKNYQKSDEIRGELKKQGYIIKDTKEEQKVYKD